MFTFRIDSQLELRLLQEHHAEELFAAVDANRAHLRRWLPWVDSTASADDTRAFIRRSLDQLARNDGMSAAICAGGQIVGVIGLHYIKWTSRKTEIGYWLAQSAQGKGIMTRTCRGLIDCLFNELKLNRVEIRCAFENHRSRAVPGRLGFTQEGVLREGINCGDKLVDDVVYGLLAREWPAQVERSGATGA